MKKLVERPQGGGKGEYEDSGSYHDEDGGLRPPHRAERADYHHDDDDSWGEGEESFVARRDQETERQHLGDGASHDLRQEEEAVQQQQSHAVEELQEVSGCHAMPYS